MIPEFLEKPSVLGVGEIGLNKNSKNEMTILEEQIALASEHDQLILVHTPHLEDKLKGTRLIMDAIERNGNVDPSRVLIDHVEEHTVKPVLDRGFWCGMTLYPETKCTPQRAADIIEMYGDERIWINSAGDWGPSDPLSVPKAQREMLKRGHTRSASTRSPTTTLWSSSPRAGSSTRTAVSMPESPTNLCYCTNVHAGNDPRGDPGEPRPVRRARPRAVLPGRTAGRRALAA